MTDLFAVAARLDARVVAEAIPPSVRRELAPAPPPRPDGDSVVLDCGPWVPRQPVRHLLPSLALLAPRPPSARFELSTCRSGAWSPWIATAALGDHTFSLLPATIDGLRADIDEVRAAPPVDAVRLRVRIARSDEASFEAPWLLTLSLSNDQVADLGAVDVTTTLTVPPRTQMTEPEAIRLRICSPTSVAMALEYFGCTLPTRAVAEEVFHAPTDRYGVWPAAIRTAAAHGIPGYLLRFPGWESAAWCLSRGLPIVASVRYARGELTNAAMCETTGHLIVLTGLEGDEVLVNDPAAPTAAEVRRRYTRRELTRAWLEKSGVGYVFFRHPGLTS
jgi:hypothetical protein